MSQTTELATLGGGCFWCTEAVFLRVEGVVSVESGYAGGHTTQPSYEQICDGDTGHAEVVNVTFDPAKINYREILDIFFATHDPTQLNRQGNDVGTQYRSVIFTHSDEQRDIALQAIRELESQGLYIALSNLPGANHKDIDIAIERHTDEGSGVGFSVPGFVLGGNVVTGRIVSISPVWRRNARAPFMNKNYDMRGPELVIRGSGTSRND